MKKTNTEKKFVVGSGEEMPAWAKEEAAKGRMKTYYDDEGEIDYVRVYSTTKTYDAIPGDTIILLKSGLAVIPEYEAKKFGVTKEASKND